MKSSQHYSSYRICFIHSIVLLLLPATLPNFVHAQIRILQPPQLAEQFPPSGSIKGSTAAFGTPYWGEQLLGKLEYSVSKGNNYCTGDDYDLPQLSVDPLSSNTSAIDSNDMLDSFPRWPLIVVVRRGKCHFAEKVKVAQDYKGASAVIILDDEGSLRTPTEIRSIIMADDGQGSKIRIPSILISDNEGQKLINILKTGQTVIAELMWDIPNNDVVQVDQWMSPGLSTSVQFLQLFAPFARTLQHRINFRPHFFLFNLPVDANSMCLDPAAKFCSMPPDWHDSTDVTGMQVVQEIMRESCLWFTTKSINIEDFDGGGEYSEDWWNYMENVGDKCFRPPKSSAYYSKPFTKECSDDLMRELGIDPSKVQSCIDTVGTTELTSHLYNHAWSPTAMMINDARFSGPLDPFVVARAICTGFTLSTEPHECTALKTRHIHDVLFPKQPPEPYIFGESLSYHKGGVAWWVYVLSIMAAIFVCIGAVAMYRLVLLKQLRTELRYEVFEEVKSQLTDKIQTQHKESGPFQFEQNSNPIPSQRSSGSLSL